MPWERLWADLDSQAEAWERAELSAEVAERVQIERSQVEWMDRLRASIGHEVGVVTLGGRRWRGVVQVCGEDVLVLGSAEPSSLVVVPAAAVQVVSGLTAMSASVQSLGPSASRRTLRSVLRRVAADHGIVVAHLVDGATHAGEIVVGRDYLDVVADGDVLTVPVAALAALTPG